MQVSIHDYPLGVFTKLFCTDIKRLTDERFRTVGTDKPACRVDAFRAISFANRDSYPFIEVFRSVLLLPAT